MHRPALALTLACAPAAFGYTFTNVADTTGTFSGFDFVGISAFHAIGDAGHIAFSAEFDDGGITRQGLFLADTAAPGLPIVKLLDDTGPYATWETGIGGVNTSGTVAVTLIRDDASREVALVSAGGVVTPLARTGGTFDALSDAPSINASGRVAFAGRPGGSGSGPFTQILGSDAGTPFNAPDIVEDASGPYDAFFIPTINDAGQVLYFASDDAPDAASLVLEDAGGSQSVLAISNSVTGPLVGLIPNTVNNDGDAIFVTRLLADTERSVLVYDADNDTTSTILGPGSPLNTTIFPEVDINDADVTLISLGDTSGIYLGPDPSTDAILEAGDMLFGEVVTNLAAIRTLNNLNQVSFLYATDTRLGLAVTVVPEPGLLALLPAALLAVRRRRGT